MRMRVHVSGTRARPATMATTACVCVVAPTGLTTLVAHDGDLALAVPGSWYQAYFPGDRERIARILQRLRAAQVHTLAVDTLRGLQPREQRAAGLQHPVPARAAACAAGHRAEVGGRVPAPLLARLNEAAVSALRLPGTRERFATLGMDVTPMTPQESQSFQRAEVEKWAKVIKAARLTIT